MSSWTTTVPNSVRISAPVGQTSRQAASVQCLHTSLDISQRRPSAASATVGTGLLDEGHVAPGRRAQADGVVVGHPGQAQPVLGHRVPLLAGDLAGLAADADRRVGEEAHPRRDGPDGPRAGGRGQCSSGRPSLHLRAGVVGDARPVRRTPAPARAARARAGAAPGWMSQASALTSWMCTFGSRARCVRSLARVAGAEAVGAPVVGQPDLVQRAALHAQTGHPLGDQ